MPAGVGRRRRRCCRRGETLRRRCRWPEPRPPGAESRPDPKLPPLLHSSSPSPDACLGGKWHLGGRGNTRAGVGGAGSASACFEPVWGQEQPEPWRAEARVGRREEKAGGRAPRLRIQ